MARRLPALPILLTLAGLVVACAATPEPSFDPMGPCSGDGRRAGAYPELEALLPDRYEGVPPTGLDSGRSCSDEALGTLAEAGFAEVRFAGATWDLGGGRGLTVAVFEGDGLDAARMIDFYEAGARTARRIQALQRSESTVAGLPALRLDVLVGQSGQTIVAWPGGVVGRVHVVLAADLGDARLSEALERLGGP